MYSSIGNSIVVIITRYGVLLAADSKSSNNTGKKDASKSTVCKIYKCNDFYFAIDGYVYQEPWYKLDRIVWDAVSNATSFEDAIADLEMNWKKALDETYLNLSTKFRDYFLKNYDLINHSSVTW